MPLRPVRFPPIKAGYLGRPIVPAVPVVPYDPSIDPQVFLWLDASVPANFNAGAGGNQVSGWLDQSQQQNNCFQFTGIQQPSTVAAAYNGLDCLRFSSPFGIGQNLVGSASLRECSIFVVGSAGGPSQCWVDFYTDPPYAETVSLRVDSSSLVALSRGSSVLEGPALPSGLSLWSVACDDSSASLSLDRSPVATDSTAVDLGFSGNYSVGYSIAGGSAPLVGDLCEILAYAIVLADADRASVEAYLMTKWGVA